MGPQVTLFLSGPLSRGLSAGEASYLSCVGMGERPQVYAQGRPWGPSEAGHAEEDPPGAGVFLSLGPTAPASGSSWQSTVSMEGTLDLVSSISRLGTSITQGGWPEAFVLPELSVNQWPHDLLLI